MSYDTITKEAYKERRAQLREARKMQLYTEIWRDVAAVLKLVLPKDKVIPVSNHLKSMYFNLIELKTGIRPDKI